MKKFLTFTLAAAVLLIIVAPLTWAQESGTEEFTLEDVVVTAEKREVNVQDIPASITALVGTDLVEQGKVTAAQMLEDVPNLSYGNATRGLGANSGITIRGVKRTEEVGGPSGVTSPSSANYVDGIYDGVGSDFDIERIEVLRGPQGTLYGRAAAGGVVAFHTKDPWLEEFDVDAFVEFGSASLFNTQGAINVPIGDKVAFRAAFHYLKQDDDYWAGQGIERETTEGRIKLLFQPSEEFSLLLSYNKGETRTISGGWTQYLPEPNTIIEQGIYVEPGVNPPQKSEQYALEAYYHLGNSTLSYIGAIHERDNRGPGAVGFNRGSFMYTDMGGEPTETQTHEIRWTSDTEGPLHWLVGASYYDLSWHKVTSIMQVSVAALPDLEASFNAPVFAEDMQGNITEYGIFTENTYDLRDDMRITLGLRYDDTEVNDNPSMSINKNVGPMGASLNPPDWVTTPSVAITPTFNEITYKVRFEYDLTPENMLYALTGTGYISGMFAWSPEFVFPPGPPPPPGTPPAGVTFIRRDYEQMEVTSYELGSKNRFLDNTLQLNGALFYLDFEGYQQAVNINPGAPPPPVFAVVSVPVIMKGLEMDASWLFTAYDKVSLSAGWLDAKIDDFPPLPDSQFTTRDMMYLERVPGLPEWTATLAYDHTHVFNSGATMVPRIEARFTSSYYIDQVSRTEAEDQGLLPYVLQDSTVIWNLGVTWTSPLGKYSITGYVRNLLDEVVKMNFMTSMGQGTPHSVSLGDPRTFGMIIRAKF